MDYTDHYYDDPLDYEGEEDYSYDAEDGLGNDESGTYDQDYPHDDPANDIQDDVSPPPANPVGDVPVVDFRSMLTLCAEHGNHVSLDCVHCKKLQEVVSPDLLKQMGITISDSDSSIPEASTWLSQSKPTKKHTLTLAPGAFQFAKDVFFSAPLSKTKYEEIIKDHLLLSFEANHELTKNLHLEKILTKMI